MRALLTALALLAVVGTAWAGSPLVRELQALSTRYNENPEKIDELKAALEKAGESQAADVDTLLASPRSASCTATCAPLPRTRSSPPTIVAARRPSAPSSSSPGAPPPNSGTAPTPDAGDRPKASCERSSSCPP